MKRNDVEKMLNTAAKGLAPDVYQRALEAEVVVEPLTQEVSTSRRFSLRKLALTLSIVLILLISGGSLIGLSTAEAESVYLDINPSIELVLNHFDRVIAVNYYNDDAESLFADYKIKGKKIDEVIEVFIANANTAGYFDAEDSAMYISVASNNSKRAENSATHLKAVAANIIAQKGIAVGLEKQNASGVSKQTADSYNISVGKLKVIQNIIALDSSYTIEELKDLSMRELNLILRQIAAQPSNNQNDNGQGGQNQGAQDQNTPAGQNGHNG
ncbi:MAG: hypothetical protein EOM87_02260 [Clostridia bacterium]|nr:hypothetical protein [Clostridia bacterium]